MSETPLKAINIMFLLIANFLFMFLLNWFFTAVLVKRQESKIICTYIRKYKTLDVVMT